MVVNWPTTLPQKPNEDGYGLETGDNVLRSEMDAGPVKTRRTSTVSVDGHSISFHITKDQYVTLDNFYKLTLANGSLTFTAQHPITDVSTVFRFVGAPSYRPLGGVKFEARMAWEQVYEVP